MTRRHWRIIITVLIIVVVGGVVGLSMSGRPILWQPPVTPPTQPGKAKAARTVVPGPTGLTLHGQVQAIPTNNVTAPATGKVVALIAPEGQPVVAGQQLLQLDVPGLRQQLSSARQQLQHLQALEEKANDPELRHRLEEEERRVQGMTLRLQQMRDELAQYQAQHPDAAAVLDTYQARQAEAADASLEFRHAVDEFNKVQQAYSKTGKLPANYNQLSERVQKAQQRNREALANFDAARQARARSRDEITRLSLLRDRVTSGQTLLKATQVSLEKLRKNPAVAMIAQGRERLRKQGDEVARLERQVASLAIKAPASGTVREMRARPGQQVMAGQTLVVLAGPGSSRLVLEASKSEAQRLAVGMRAKVTATPGGDFDCTVSQIVAADGHVRIYLVPLKQAQLPAPGTPLQARL